MASSSESAADAEPQPVPVASIVALVGKGMTAREITKVFPELEPEDIRLALLRAAELMRNADASLHSGDGVAEIIRSAQRNSGLSEEDAMELAVNETRAARKERASRK